MRMNFPIHSKTQSDNIPSWDELFMRHVYLISTKSKDKHTKIGAVLVRDRALISEGYNGLPRKINDEISERWERPEKYYWCEHGERNSIYHCAKNGIKTEGTTLYSMGVPCADCCRGLINSGIIEVVVHYQWEKLGINKSNDKWKESIERSNVMFEEAGVKLREFDTILGISTLIDGVYKTV